MRLRERGDSIIFPLVAASCQYLVNMIAQRDAKEKGGTWNFRTDENLRKSEILSLGAAPGAIP